MSRIARIHITFDNDLTPDPTEIQRLERDWYDLLMTSTALPSTRAKAAEVCQILAHALARAKVGSAITDGDVLVIDDPATLQITALDRDNKTSHDRRRLIQSLPSYPDARLVLRHRDGEIERAEIWMGGGL